jgi:hypothetical protein
VETARTVLKLRTDTEADHPFPNIPAQPGLILTSPSLYRGIYDRQPQAVPRELGDPRIVRKTLRLLQNQTGFQLKVPADDVFPMMESEPVKAALNLRREETTVHTLAVGLRAASTLAATVRLPPAVNRAAGSIRQLANHARAPASPQHKFGRLFRGVQSKLSEAVGKEICDLIASYEGEIKLVTDAPLEWLPIDGVPLSLRFHTSRITSTPGNLMVGELASPPLIMITPDDFREILIVTAIDANDRLRDLLLTALDGFAPLWKGKLTIRSVEVSSEEDFVRALNSYHGPIAIFDGHGAHAADDVATLRVGASNIDVWQLRGKVHVAPIVILSACDTHAADRSHATTANGFLTLGARTVLGTLLPIGGPSAAVFLARLIYRVFEYIPSAIDLFGRSLLWSEVVGGMLRMHVVTDFLRPLTSGMLTAQNYERITTLANHAINSGNQRWYEEVAKIVADHAGMTLEGVRTAFEHSIPYSDTIRYVQIGSPETILITDSTIYDFNRQSESPKSKAVADLIADITHPPRQNL